MKIDLKKFMTIFFILLMSLSLFAPMVFAVAMPTEVEASGIPVRISLGGSAPKMEEDYKIVLKADDPDYPMPTGSVDALFTMNIAGENSRKLPSIKFSSIGIYTYTISQKAGVNELASYDETLYNLVIYVTNAEVGGLETTILLYKTGDTKKFDEALFYNEYEEIVIIEEEDSPLGPIIIEDEETPLGEADLPKTGASSSGIFYLAGASILTAGVVLKKKEK